VPIVPARRYGIFAPWAIQGLTWVHGGVEMDETTRGGGATQWDPAPPPRRTSTRRPAVVVVGGGVVGCAIAFELSREGWAVTLLERDAIARHASGRSAGNLNPLHGTPPRLLPLALEAFQIHAEVRNALARLGCAGFAAAPVRRLHLGLDEADRSTLEQTAGLFAAQAGFSAEWVEGERLREMEPRLGADVRFGVLTRGNLSVDSGAFTRSLAEGAARLGTRVVTQSALGLVSHGDTVAGVRTGEGTVACDAVVFATGPWAAEANAWLGLDLPIEPVKGEMLLLRPPSGPSRYDLTWGATALYMRGEDQVWLGGSMTRSGFDAAPTAAARTDMLARAARFMPDILDAAVLEHVAALRPMIASHLPVAVRASGWSNAYVANGAGSKGVLLSVGIARAVGDLLGRGQAERPGSSGAAPRAVV
jgi:glycine oxidase